MWAARGISRVLSAASALPHGTGVSGEGSFLWDRHCCRPQAAYPGLRWRGPRLVPYLALLRVGFAMRPLLPAARCALTAPFHPCLCDPRERAPPSAVFSLLHFPSPCGARALPGTLPFGARTFLQRTLNGLRRRSLLARSPRTRNPAARAGFYSVHLEFES